MATDIRLKEALPEITEAVVATYTECNHTSHLGHKPLPSREVIVDILADLMDILYPGFIRRQNLHIGNVEYHVGDLIDGLHDKLTQQIGRALRHEYDYSGPDSRVVIPEPSLWDPISPFLYHGPVELWEDGQRVEQITIRHGLCSKTLNTHGLRWNGRPLTLRSRDVQTGSEDEMLALRAAGYNLLTAPLGDMELWERADRIGFLVLGRVRTPDEAVPAELADHPSCLGFLFDADVWSQVDRDRRERFRACGFVGVELHEPPVGPLPPGLDFVACDAERCEEMVGVGLPVILMRDASLRR